MRIGLITDTHLPSIIRHLDELGPEIAEFLCTVDLILHGGDVTSPIVLDWCEQFAPVLVAQGNNDDFSDPRMQRRQFLDIEGWYLEGTRGAEIAPSVAPRPQDIDLIKTKQSGFHGTPLLDLLVAAQVDTVVITGGSTSNCVRATAIDSASYNFRTIVPRDAVFDRVRISHEVNLMDIARQLGDVVGSD